MWSVAKGISIVFITYQLCTLLNLYGAFTWLLSSSADVGLLVSGLGAARRSGKRELKGDGSEISENKTILILIKSSNMVHTLLSLINAMARNNFGWMHDVFHTQRLGGITLYLSSRDTVLLESH